jgi:hypothetical protein
MAQGKYTISGTITSKTGGASLIGATIRMTNGTVGTATNAYGFYSLTLPKVIQQSDKKPKPLRSIWQPIKSNIAPEDNTQERQTPTIVAAPRGDRDLDGTQRSSVRTWMPGRDMKI